MMFRHVRMAAVVAVMAICGSFSAVHAASLQDGILEAARSWAAVKYGPGDDDVKAQKMQALADKLALMSRAYPDKAEPLIWQGIVLATEAGYSGGFSGLSLAKKAKAVLEKAVEMDPRALNGGGLVTLGSLYYQVPGWPIGFGDDDKAGALLRQALDIAPNDIDANYFYGDYLLDQKKYDEALTVLKHALEAPPRPGRERADRGRREEIRKDIEAARAALADGTYER